MHRIAPAVLVASNIGLSALLEGHRASLSKTGLGYFFTPRINRICASEKSPARFQGSVTRLCERYRVKWPQTHLSSFTAYGVAEEPGFGANAGNLQP